VFSDRIPTCNVCGGLVKPDIVFFGESLPRRFFDLLSTDASSADLLIVIGTSLQVQPFASIIKKVKADCPRLLINWEEVGVDTIFDGFLFNHPNNYRDIKCIGDCQASIKKFAQLLGWEEELENLVKAGHAKLLTTASTK